MVSLLLTSTDHALIKNLRFSYMLSSTRTSARLSEALGCRCTGSALQEIRLSRSTQFPVHPLLSGRGHLSFLWESGVHVLSHDGAEVSIVVEAAVLVIMYPLYVPSRAGERVCSVWAAACHQACSTGGFWRKTDTNVWNAFLNMSKVINSLSWGNAHALNTRPTDS